MTITPSNAFLICLLASLFWAPLVYAAAALLDRREALAISEKIWLAALAFAVLPALLAPALSTAGVSLRPAKTLAGSPPVTAADDADDAALAGTPQTYRRAVRADAPRGAPEPLPAPPAAPAELAAKPFVAEPPAGIPDGASSAWSAGSAQGETDAPSDGRAGVIGDAPGRDLDRPVPSPAFAARTRLFEQVFPQPPQLETGLRLLGLLYVYGAVLAFGLWLLKTLALMSSTILARKVDDPRLEAAVAGWREQLGLDGNVRLKQTARVSSVCLTGYFRPVILLPGELRERIAFNDLVMMCAHELAHVKRGDVRLFAAGAAARIIFWFNPFVKRIAARAELAAEQCADGLVVSAGANRRAYAACFVEGLRFAARRPVRAGASTPSFTPFDKRGRRMRLESILGATLEAVVPARTKLLFAGAGLAAAAAVVAQAAVAVPPRAPNEDAAILTRMPADGRVTATFGMPPRQREGGARDLRHRGIDIAAALGTDVVAAGDGVVTQATDLFEGEPAWGKVVVINHGDGVETRYANLDSYAVRDGAAVAAGDVIAKVGASGRAKKPHLHFETLVEDKTVDPLAMLPGGAPAAAGKPAPAQAFPDEPAEAPEPKAEGDRAAAEPARVSRSRSAPEDGTAPQPFEVEVADEVAGKVAADVVSDLVDVGVDVVVNTEGAARGRDLNADERARVVREIEAMKRRSARAEERRERQRKARRREESEQSIAQRFAEEARRLTEAHLARERQLFTTQFKHRFETEKNLLKIRNRALEQARRSIEHAQQQILRGLEQAERDLDRSARSLDLSNLPKEDFARFTAELRRAREDLRAQKAERLEALREAERTIRQQQSEIEELRAELERARRHDLN